MLGQGEGVDNIDEYLPPWPGVVMFILAVVLFALGETLRRAGRRVEVT